MKNHNTNFLQFKKIEDKKVDTNNESYETNNEYNNNINPYLIENKILDNINNNEDIEINHKKNRKNNYKQNLDNNEYDDNFRNKNNFDDINKKRNFLSEREKYEMIYSNANQNINSEEENKKTSIEDNLNRKNKESDNDEFDNDNKENNNYLMNNFEKVEENFKNNNNQKLMTKILNLNNNKYDNQKSQYEEEINRLKQEIADLENDNEFLSNQLIEEEKKNEELHLIKNENEENDNTILSDISHCLQVNSFEEILPKLTEMINYLNKYNNDKSSKIKEDTISKLKSLYIISNNSKEKKDNIGIQDLWRWVKQLIEEVDELSNEKEKYEEIYNRNNNDIYRNFCEKLIKEFGLNSFDELKFFINDLMTKNELNKKRVEKLRKVLINNNNYEEEESFSNNNINNNKFNNYNYNEENVYGNNMNHTNSMRIKKNNSYNRYVGKNGNNSLNKKLKHNYYYNENQF